MVSLAMLLEAGKGVAADRVEACRWLQKAAQKGHSAANTKLSVLTSRLSADEQLRWHEK